MQTVVVAMRFLRKLLFRLRAQSGELSVGFHHYRLGWEGKAQLLQKEDCDSEIQLMDSVGGALPSLHRYYPRSTWNLNWAIADVTRGRVFLNGHDVRDASGDSPRPSRPWTRAGALSGKTYDGPLVLASMGSANYYHWLIEELPVVLRAKLVSPEVEALVPSHYPQYVGDSLEAIGVRKVCAEGAVWVKDLVLPTRRSDTGWPHPHDLSLIVRHLGFQGVQLSKDRRIYISRRLSSRGARNEEILESRLRDYEFEIVMLESLSLHEQMKLFAEASCVVGLHGAGLANLVFARPGTNVIEIAPQGRAIPCFEVIAVHRRLKYSRLVLASDSLDEVYLSCHEVDRVVEKIAEAIY